MDGILCVMRTNRVAWQQAHTPAHKQELTCRIRNHSFWQRSKWAVIFVVNRAAATFRRTPCSAFARRAHTRINKYIKNIYCECSLCAACLSICNWSVMDANISIFLIRLGHWIMQATQYTMIYSGRFYLNRVYLLRFHVASPGRYSYGGSDCRMC